MYLLTPRTVASTLLAACACGYAAWRGRGVERLGAAAIGGSWVLSPAVQLHPLSRLQWGTLGLDAATAGALVGLALRSDRWWPMPAAALVLLVVVEHLGYALEPRGIARAYFAGEAIWSYALLAVLVAGAALEGRGPLSRATSRDFSPGPRPRGRASP